MTVYVCPTFNCNLSCPHCDIKSKKSVTDISKIIESAKAFPNANFVLFGGEPLSISDESFKKLVEEIPFKSISTNLLLLSTTHAELLKKKCIDISTSWNPARFTPEQYIKWKKNLKFLLENGQHVTILVTLTEDLFKSDIFQMLDDLDGIHSEFLEGVKFEPLVPSTPALIEEADKWMVELSRNWNHPYPNITAQNYKKGNIQLCKHIWTIQPNGTAVNSCPTSGKNYFLNNCLSCKYNKVCRPCMKQECCTFLERLYLEVTCHGNESW